MTDDRSSTFRVVDRERGRPRNTTEGYPTAWSVGQAESILIASDAEKVRIPKQLVSELPSRFEEKYPANGMQNEGAVASYRDGKSHVIEYPDYWKIHRDDVDPSKDPVGHLLQDAPKAALLLVIAAAIILSD